MCRYCVHSQPCNLTLLFNSVFIMICCGILPNFAKPQSQSAVPQTLTVKTLRAQLSTAWDSEQANTASALTTSLVTESKPNTQNKSQGLHLVGVVGMVSDSHGETQIKAFAAVASSSDDQGLAFKRSYGGAEEPWSKLLIYSLEALS